MTSRESGYFSNFLLFKIMKKVFIFLFSILEKKINKNGEFFFFLDHDFQLSAPKN